ncbi:intermembrane phospholipid transport protein YdbH family protein [Sphingosinicella rhizophila]|uniref:YdbH domain-containing protein n=1 Tax=Sphingosinicella rhizophila TaxID=3050082 RepID=A0ABU3QAL4_9SPHN|nr:YdbH domain-containing protein [Sphingosinicella sp. GR2756]MDT9600444.1 YdbH domain-containing protein [Sphingosinicella sp. GR2756]
MKRLIAFGFGVLFLILFSVVWTLRRPIATDFIDRELARRGVQASYELKRIGFRTQRLENLVIGDPKRPDLTARWVEVELSWGLRAPKVGLIRARGVRLMGRMAKGKLSFGQIDRLLPPPSGLPFRLPDQNVDIADATLSLDVPAGRIGVAIEGKGNLANGFRGEMAAASRRLALDTCLLSRPAVSWNIAISDLRPHLQGPAQAASLACGDDLALERPQIRVDATLAEALDAWRGKAFVTLETLRFGTNNLARVGGSLSFDGNMKRTLGTVEMASSEGRLGDFDAARIMIDGRYAASPAQGSLSLLADARGRGMSGGRSVVGPLVAALSSVSGTPVGPIADALAGSVTKAFRRFDIGGSLRVVHRPAGGAVRLEEVEARSRSGVRLAVSGGEGISFYWPKGLIQVDGGVALSGGGLPSARFDLNQARGGGAISGVGRVSPFTARGARLALGEIRFTASSGGATLLRTVASMDGPIGDGRITGLVVPVRARFGESGGFAFGEDCMTIAFRRLELSGLRLGATRLPVCPSGRAILWKRAGGEVQGGALIRSPRLAGRLGDSPLSLTADRFRFGLADSAFTGADIAVRLGSADAVSRLDLGTLSGRFGRDGVTGDFAGAAGKLANVPLLISQGKGDWQLRKSKLLVGGGFRIADEQQPVRFHPLATSDFRLTLIDDQIVATAGLQDPKTGTRIAIADIRHSLGTGRGKALIDVPGIAFNPSYQPEDLTPLTLGVISLVKGVLKGRGEIAWDEKGSSSSGTFGTDDMDLAAAFGPVEGLATQIHFTDLLGLVSAPGQEAKVDLVRTGLDVPDGLIRYQLLPGLRVRVEGGRWPFSGGELLLEETILDFSAPDQVKKLTFRVVGLDAASFVQMMEFSNINATGTFDGVVPMIFDKDGGRIVDGRLDARTEGGTLSYVGELSDRDLGAYGKLAFDALKSLRYNKLNMGLSGSLDGEFITTVELDGVARNPSLVTKGGGIKGMVVGRALGQLAKIPFEFNITIKGPFRSLFATARSFEDPSNLILLLLPEELEKRIGALTVQPKESETVR